MPKKLLVLLVVVAVAAVAGGSVAGTARSTTTCLSTFHMWILGYGYTPDPSYGPLNSCWQGGSSSYLLPLKSFVDCQAEQFHNGTKGNLNASNAIYDETSWNHDTSYNNYTNPPPDGTSMSDCYFGGGPYNDPQTPNWVNSTIDGEYMAPVNSSCSSPGTCWYRIGASVTGFNVNYWFAELYSGSGAVGNMMSVWEQNTAWGAGVLSLDPYTVNGPYVTNGQGAGIENWVGELCAATPNGNRLGVYTAYPMADHAYASNPTTAIDHINGNGYHTVEWWLIQAMNSCTS